MGFSLGGIVSAIVPPRAPTQATTPVPEPAPVAQATTPEPEPAPTPSVVYEPSPPLPSEPVTYSAPVASPAPSAPAPIGVTPTSSDAASSTTAASPAPSPSRVQTREEVKSMLASVSEARDALVAAIKPVQTAPAAEPVQKPESVSLTYAQIIAQASSQMILDVGGPSRGVLDLIET